MAEPRLLEGARDAEALVAHMRRHSAESGRHGDPVFMPWGAEHPLDLRRYGERRRRIWRLPLDVPGWGRTWGLVAGARIVGHVELNGGSVPAELHRCTLGMGLERAWRGAGHGRALLALAIEWARAQPRLDWLDLGVFGENARARELYRRAGFEEVGRCPDRYRVDGQSIEDVSMTLRVDAGQRAAP